MKRRHFILLLGGGSSGALGVGTGAFSSVDAERDVEVSVVEDENAYLGLERLDAADSVRVGDETKVVRIKNQFAAPLSLSVVVDHKEGGIGEIGVDDPVEIVETVDEAQEDEDGGLQTGHEAHISVECDSSGDTSFTVSFYGVAGEASVDKTRTFEITCEEADDNNLVERADEEEEEEEKENENENEKENENENEKEKENENEKEKENEEKEKENENEKEKENEEEEKEKENEEEEKEKENEEKEKEE